MADVRLTATNPEDSSVVPVACDAAGRLLLEEPQVVEGPPGPQGEQGPPGQNGQDGLPGQNGQDGDPFSGNFADDVTFGGSATFAGDIKHVDYGEYGFSLATNNSLKFTVQTLQSDYMSGANDLRQVFKTSYNNSSGSDIKFAIQNTGTVRIGGIINNTADTSDANIQLNTDGSATFAGDVVVGSRFKQWMLVEQGGLCHMVQQVRANTADLVGAVDATDGKYPELRDVFAELNIVERALEEVMVKLRMQVPAGWPVWDGSDEISTLPRQNS